MSRKTKIIRMNITLTPKHREYLRREAYLADKNMSWVIRKIIENCIKEEGGIKPVKPNNPPGDRMPMV